MRVRIELDEKVLKQLVENFLLSQLGDIILNPKDIKIEVKSSQNYKAEWETANFRAVYQRSE